MLARRLDFLCRTAKHVFISCLLLVAGVALSAEPNTNQNPFESSALLKPTTEIDKLVVEDLKKLNLQPANLCSDAVFVRRALLDVIGTLPTAREAAAFLQSRAPNKRAALIDRLLERDEF